MRLPVILLIAMLAVPVMTMAQVPVEVSSNKVTSGGKSFYIHEVLKGQTLYSISRAYKVSVEEIIRENAISEGGIQTGQMLRIPATGIPAAPVRPAATTGSPSGDNKGVTPPEIPISKQKIVSFDKVYYMHEIKKGQTLYSIAKAYKVTVIDITRENPWASDGIFAGQVLKIPASSSLTIENPEDLPAEKASGKKPEQPAKQTSTSTGKDDSKVKKQEMPEEPAVKDTPKENPATAARDTKKTDAGTSSENPGNGPGAVEKNSTVSTPAGTEERQADTNKEDSTSNKPDTAEPKNRYHKVQKGETLTSIAKKFDVTTGEIRKLNKGLLVVTPGMRLIIPPEKSDDNQSGRK